MKIAGINMVPYGSTGKIMLQISDVACKKGYVVKTFSTTPFSKGKKEQWYTARNHYNWGSFNENRIHYYLGVIFGANGLFSHRGTKKLITELKQFKPDIIHLHNLHSFCINLPILFSYLKKSNARVVWTLHDCWAFTGKCPYFDMAGCERWRDGCHDCVNLRGYPRSLIDTSRRMYKKKKELFCGVKNMILVTPSVWLSNLVKQSFLKEYPVRVINNGIDLSVFKPTESGFRKKYKIPENKKIVLGVAFGWGERKGLDVFIKLAMRLDYGEYQIVLVGTDDNVDKLISDKIISIHRTLNQKELAEIYTAADVFVNPTREEVFGLVNVEALACGTPVITFNTGGSPEILDKDSGVVVEKNDIEGMLKEILRICTEKPFSEEQCIKRAKQFDIYDKYKEYINLYENSSLSTKFSV